MGGYTREETVYNFNRTVLKKLSIKSPNDISMFSGHNSNNKLNKKNALRNSMTDHQNSGHSLLGVVTSSAQDSGHNDAVAIFPLTKYIHRL